MEASELHVENRQVSSPISRDTSDLITHHCCPYDRKESQLEGLQWTRKLCETAAGKSRNEVAKM